MFYEHYSLIVRITIEIFTIILTLQIRRQGHKMDKLLVLGTYGTYGYLW